LNSMLMIYANAVFQKKRNKKRYSFLGLKISKKSNLKTSLF
jgi:hypothetical protein